MSDNIKYIVIFLLLLSSPVFSLEISDCSSDTKAWSCEYDKICKCTVSGKCTNGNILVYKNDISDLICLPSIVGRYAEINRGDCGDPTGEVKVKADCDEGQSLEETIKLSALTTTTTTTTKASCGDDTCDSGENYLNCKEDCPSGGSDLYCDRVPDGICDPDCSSEEDADCKKESPEGFLDTLNLVILAITAIVLLLIYRWFKKKEKSRIEKIIRRTRY